LENLKSQKRAQLALQLEAAYGIRSGAATYIEPAHRLEGAEHFKTLCDLTLQPPAASNLKEALREGGGLINVERIRKWLDVPKPMGLPDEKAWKQALERSKGLFGVNSPTLLLNVGNVSEVCMRLRVKVEMWLPASSILEAELDKAAPKLGLSPRQAQRPMTSREALCPFESTALAGDVLARLVKRRIHSPHASEQLASLFEVIRVDLRANSSRGTFQPPFTPLRQLAHPSLCQCSSQQIRYSQLCCYLLHPRKIKVFRINP